MHVCMATEEQTQVFFLSFIMIQPLYKSFLEGIINFVVGELYYILTGCGFRWRGYVRDKGFARCEGLCEKYCWGNMGKTNVFPICMFA